LLACVELQERSQILELLNTPAEMEGELLSSSPTAAKVAIPTKGRSTRVKSCKDY